MDVRRNCVLPDGDAPVSTVEVRTVALGRAVEWASPRDPIADGIAAAAVELARHAVTPLDVAEGRR